MNDIFFIDYEAKLMLTDTLGMRPDCELAHRRLCDVLWAHGRAPVNDDIALRDISRVGTQDWDRVKGELMQKGWHVDNGLFTHKGCVNTMERCRSKHAKTVAAAKAGAVARWGEQGRQSKPGNDAAAMRRDCQSESESQSIKKNTAPCAVDGEVKKVERTPAQKEAWRQHLLGEDIKIGWRKLFHENCKLDYQMTGVDRGQLKLFVKDTKMSIDTILTIAKSALTVHSKSGFSHCRNTKSLAYFCNHFNEIRTEVVESARPNPHPHWPPRIDVERYAKEKGDDRGYWVSWFEFWSKKDFKRGEFTIDWQIELGKQLANRRQPV